MAKVLGLDLGTNSIGWTIADTSASKMDIRVEIAPEAFIRLNERRRIARQKTIASLMGCYFPCRINSPNWFVNLL